MFACQVELASNLVHPSHTHSNVIQQGMTSHVAPHRADTQAWAAVEPACQARREAEESSALTAAAVANEEVVTLQLEKASNVFACGPRSRLVHGEDWSMANSMIRMRET